MAFQCKISFPNLGAQSIKKSGGFEKDISLTLLMEMLCAIFCQHVTWQTSQDVHDFLNEVVHSSRKADKCVCVHQFQRIFRELSTEFTRCKRLTQLLWC